MAPIWSVACCSAVAPCCSWSVLPPIWRQRLGHREQWVGGLVDAVGELLGAGGKLRRAGPGGVQTGCELAGAVIDLRRSVGELFRPVGGLFDSRTGRDDHGQHLIDRLPGDPGRYGVEHLVDGGAADARRDVVVGVVVDGDQVGFLRLPGHRRRDRLAEVRRQLEHEVVLAVFDSAVCLLGAHDVPVQAAVGGQALGDLGAGVELLPGDDGAAVGVDQRHGHLVHMAEGIPERPQVQRSVHQRQQHQHDDRCAGHPAAAETLDFRTECESSQHR